MCLRDGCKVTTEVMLGTLQQAVLVLQGLPFKVCYGFGEWKNATYSLCYTG